jgi:hypothetical protein
MQDARWATGWDATAFIHMGVCIASHSSMHLTCFVLAAESSQVLTEASVCCCRFVCCCRCICCCRFVIRCRSVCLCRCVCGGSCGAVAGVGAAADAGKQPLRSGLRSACTCVHNCHLLADEHRRGHATGFLVAYGQLVVASHPHAQLINLRRTVR